MKKDQMFFLILCLLFIPSAFSQNIGIGTSTPTRAKLELNGTVGNTTAIFGGEAAGIGLVSNWPEVGFNGYYNGGPKYIATGYAAFQSFDPGNGIMSFDMYNIGTTDEPMPPATRALTLNLNGYVGIGNAIPNAMLQLPNVIDNRKLVLWEAANNDHQFFGFGIESGAMTYNVGGAGDVHKFYAGAGTAASTQLMTIGGDKKVMIGTSAGGAFVGINSATATHTLTVRQAGSTGIYLEESASGTNWEWNADYFTVTSKAFLYLKYNGSVVGQFSDNGSYANFSDARLKTNVQDIPPLISKVMQLQAKSYQYIHDVPGREPSIGFIAQDVLPLFPELVTVLDSAMAGGKELKNFHSINYSGFSVVAIKAIQELQQEIDVLKTELVEVKKSLRKRK